MSQNPQEKGQFVQFPVHLIYACSGLTRDDKWVLLSIMGRYWNAGPHRLSYREIAALSGVSVSLLASYTCRETGQQREGIIARIVRVTGYLQVAIDKEIDEVTGQPRKQAQLYITINYSRIWQDNQTYCQQKGTKSVPYANTSEQKSVLSANATVSYANASVLPANGSVPYANKSVRNPRSKQPHRLPDYIDSADTEKRVGNAQPESGYTHSFSSSLDWNVYGLNDSSDSYSHESPATGSDLDELSMIEDEIDEDETIHRMPAINPAGKGQSDASHTLAMGGTAPGDSGRDLPAERGSHAAAHAGSGKSGGQASTRTGIDTLSSGASASATARGGQHADAPVAASRPPGVVSPHATPETPPSRGRKPPEMPLAAIQLLDAWDREFGLSGRPQWVVKAAIDIVTRLKGDIEDVKRVVERMRSLAKYRDKVLNLEQVANEWGLLTQKPAARATPKGGDEPDYLNQDGTTDYLKYIAYKARHPDPIAVAGQAAWGAS